MTHPTRAATVAAIALTAAALVAAVAAVAMLTACAPVRARAPHQRMTIVPHVTTGPADVLWTPRPRRTRPAAPAPAPRGTSADRSYRPGGSTRRAR